ncbi:MAG: acyl-CoA dehydrogenase family protein [Proteobacteria bacterium]|jgi:acyl-CoA dehydrogenase|nr:acyl-CoA dehydrogenase family protein [Pseudomonadota bacterium]
MAYDFGFTEEQAMVRDSLRAFMREEVLPHEDVVYDKGDVPGEIEARIRAKSVAMGFWNAHFPEDLGGGGIDNVTASLMSYELGVTTWGLISCVQGGSLILCACEGEQREKYLYPVIAGEKLDCFALTEPGAGSDAMGITTRARKDGSDWVLNGRKHFISNADRADFAIVFAVTGEDETPRGRRSRITAFLIDKGTPGMEISLGSKPIGNPGHNVNNIYFDDCRLPESQILGEEGKGFEVAGEWLVPGRVMVAANCCGKARRAIDMSMEWAATRKQFGQEIGRFQGVSFKLADMETELAAAEWLTFNAAWRLDQGNLTDADAAMAKLYASEMLGRTTDEAVQIHGGMGMMSDFPVGRLWRDARIERIWEGTSEVQRHIISRSILRPLEA